MSCKEDIEGGLFNDLLLSSRAEWKNLTITCWKMKTDFTQEVEEGADILTGYKN